VLISMKHDSANGEIGIAPSFGNRERMAAESFKKQILRDPGYIPEGIGEDVPFDSLLAAFYLVPDDRVVGVMWVYRDTEVLRRSLYFTTLKVSLEKGQDPYSVAAAISDGTLANDIRRAVRSGNFELELEISRNSGPFPADPDGVHLNELISLPLLREVDIASSRGKSFRPFITFKPTEGRPEQGSAPRTLMDRSGFAVGQDTPSTPDARRQVSRPPRQDREPAMRPSTPALVDRNTEMRAAPWFRDLRLSAALLLLFAGVVSLGVNVHSLRKELDTIKKAVPPGPDRLDELNKRFASFEVRLKEVENKINPRPPGLATYLPIESGSGGIPNLRSTSAVTSDNIICRLNGEDKLEGTTQPGTSWLRVKVIEGLSGPQEVQADQKPRKCSKGDQGFVSSRAVKPAP